MDPLSLQVVAPEEGHTQTVRLVARVAAVAEAKLEARVQKQLDLVMQAAPRGAFLAVLQAAAAVVVRAVLVQMHQMTAPQHPGDLDSRIVYQVRV